MMQTDDTTQYSCRLHTHKSPKTVLIVSTVELAILAVKNYRRNVCLIQVSHKLLLFTSNLWPVTF